MRCLAGILILCLVSIVVEGYYRVSSTYITDADADSVGYFVSGPDLLIRYTQKGRRLIPNAHVVIHNHYLSERNIEMHVNDLGFREEELEDPKPI